MKKIILAILMIALMAMTVSAVQEFSELTATLTKYEPQPAQPGKYIDVFIKLENTGIGAASNVILEVLPEFPFSIDTGKTSKTIGILGGKSFYIAEFRLKVDEGAVEGTNKLKVRFNSDESQNIWVEQKLDVSVQTQDAVLSIESIKIEPAEIIPGDKGTITLSFQNLADSFLSDIKVKLDLTSDDLPFVAYNSASEKNIYQIRARERKDVSFELIAFPDADAKIYKIPVNITYYDNVGTKYTKTDLIGVVVNSKPDIKVLVDSTTLMKEQRIGDIVLRIVNKGLNDVKFMNMKIAESEDFELLSSNNEEYIGNLDSDDFETVDFKVLLKDEETVEILITLEYMDNNNNKYVDNMNLKLKIHSAEKLGQKKSNRTMYFVLIVLIIGGIFFYRRRKKKKQH